MSSPPRRILSLWLPRFASDREGRGMAPDGPFAVTAMQAGAARLVCVNPAGRRGGARPGQALAEARALCPDLITRPHDPAADARAQAALRRWAGRYCPWVGTEGPDGLVLDITGSAHLMGGEGALLDDLLARLGRMGFAARGAIADTRGAAWALARHGRQPGRIIAAGQGAAALAPLPPAALRIAPETAEALDRLGLRCIADLTALPRATLARRFGQALLLRLDQALGAVPEPVAPRDEAPLPAVRLSFPDPIGLRGDIDAALLRLLERLCTHLQAAELGARRLRLDLLRADGSRAEAQIGLARPMRDATAMARLFDRALEDVDAGFGIDALRLSAPVTEPLAAAQITTGGQMQADDLSDLLTRLGNRVGFERLTRFLPADSHIPERSFVTASAAHADPVADWPAAPPRPLLIFPPEPLAARDSRDPPRRFTWRRQRLQVLQAEGPERITPEWWLDDPAWRSGLRDYWVVQTREGPRLWLFRTPQVGGWAVQGVFA
ncbi:DNA polymerase Y family protein [Rhodobacteraceae bacterium 2376]|uniref:DNA-directed DNA polymerase n=1 Tax=Rhabdonatronobacter sediminivivens TaxID=2743469 RepID=A0A7Z0KW51_9RHOB|nr:DNA polymerase Y family protein [Rhabdonatronobacter sediminivivens]NYS23902.1 DNA polymerase Y family protein [Rhabdonatronobacter sediminivivens]